MSLPGPTPSLGARLSALAADVASRARLAALVAAVAVVVVARASAHVAAHGKSAP